LRHSHPGHSHAGVHGALRREARMSSFWFALRPVFHPIVSFFSDALYVVSMHIGHDIFAYAKQTALRVLEAASRSKPGPCIRCGPPDQLEAGPTHPLVAGGGLRAHLSPAYRNLPTKEASEALLHGQVPRRCFCLGRAPREVILPVPVHCKDGLGWARAAAMHNIFALPVHS
jgi:hypothetical protein